MSAANFCTMRDFPLFAKDYYALLGRRSVLL